MPDVIAPAPAGSLPPESSETSPRPAVPPAPAAPAETPLLPPILAGPAVFLWLWVLPIALLLALNGQGYTLVEGNMDATQRGNALWLGAANAVNLLAGVALYFGARTMAARGASPTAQLLLRAAPAIALQVGYLLLATTTNVLPWSVRTWIYPESRYFFNQFSFAMLPLAAGVLQLACARWNGAGGRALAINLGVAVVAPVLLYVTIYSTQSLRAADAIPGFLFATMAIGLGIAMFVAIVRALMHGLRAARGRNNRRVERIAIGVFGLAMPIGGLLLNREIEFPVDFQGWEVYALTVANAAILFFASWRATSSPRLTWGLLCATFPFSLYFFIVFLPYTPLSIFAIVFFGLGLLVLTPTLLFALHLHLLNQAHHALRATQGQRSILGTGIVCGLLLPAVILGRATADKLTLNAALDHVYAPKITGADIVYGRDATELRRALASHRSYKNGVHYPLLSDFYSWWVFNHLVLPDDKLNRIEATFFGAAGTGPGGDPLRMGDRRSTARDRTRQPRAATLPRGITVKELAVQSRPADGGNRTVTLALTLHNPGTAVDEYVKALPLPPGIFVNGFRLHVAGTPVPGRIFEKKSALWVYSMIRDTERRDPGVLYYTRPEELELRVFPINAKESTVVELDFLVPGDAADGWLPASDPAAVLAELGRRATPQFAAGGRGGYFTAGTASRTALPAATREPYLHVIVDRSQEHGYTGDLRAALRQLAQRFPAAREVRITLAHHDIVDLAPQRMPLAGLAAQDFRRWERELPQSGSVALDLALAHAIRRHRDHDLDKAVPGVAVPPRPIFIVLSRDGPARKLDLTLTEHWLDLVPGFELHELTAGNAITTLRREGDAVTPLLRRGNSIRPLHPTQAVRFAAGAETTGVQAWIPETREWKSVEGVKTQAGAAAWAQAAELAQAQQDHARSPGDAPAGLRELVRASRESGILLGSTSYIVVENAAQWQMLARSEAQKLTQNSALEFREPATSVADTPTPPALYVALAFGGFLALRRWRRRRESLT